MEGFQSSELVFYGEKEYSEVVLNGAKDGTSVEDAEDKPNTEYISSVDDDKNDKEEWPLSCEEKLIPKTIPQITLYDKYVMKTILLPGRKGLRPHFYSSCTIVVEDQVLLNPEISHTLQYSVVFTKDKNNVETNLEIGCGVSELDRALEFALLDMNEGERSEIILSSTKRAGKLRDQDVMPTPFLKCIVTLKKLSKYSKYFKSSLFSDHSNLLSLVSANKDLKYQISLNEKSHGIELFNKQQIVNAFYRFSAGAKILMTLESDDFNSDPSIQCLYSTLCNNMAECQLKENNPTQAIALCERVLAHDPCNVKALYRQASAFWSIGDTDNADSVLRRLFKLDPNNPAAKRLNCDVQAKIKEYQDNYTKMMKRIFN